MSGQTDEALLNAVLAAGGVIRGLALVALGFSRRAIAEAVAVGVLVRVRRVWLAVPDADPLALAAARAGVVVSCVTQARRLGLWVLDDGPAHVAAPPTGAKVIVTQGTVVHWARPLVPRPPTMLLDVIENALALVASCQPRESALATLESALNKRLVDRDALLRLPLTASLRSLVESASPWADSGLETLFVTRLRWLKLAIRVQTWIAGHRVDILIGDRLVVQIDGGHHIGPQRAEDIRHDAQLLLSGYHVIRVGYAQVVHHWPDVQDRIMRAVAQGLHRAPGAAVRT